MSGELWTDIPNFEGAYRVSTRGRIRSIRTGNLIKPMLHGKGYEYVHLYRPGVQRCKMFVHRAVALAFLPGLTSEAVNHIDGNKRNNRVDNLEWVSIQDNTIHYFNGVTTMEERNNAF